VKKHFRTIVADPPWKFGDKLPGPARGAVKHYKVMTTAQIAAFPLPPLTEDARLFLWRVSSMPEDALTVCRAWGFEPKSEIVWVKVTACQRCNGTGIEKGGERPPRDHLCRDCADPSLPDTHPGESARRLRIGMGRQVRLAHEVCIVATRGQPKRLSASLPSVLFAPRGEHSAKPERFRDLVERLSPGPIVELFARTKRKGWDCRGDEL
jgi:N6-adenosine-specific RNA methylase IME4